MRAKAKGKTAQTVAVTILFIMLFMVLFPFYLMIINSFKIPDDYLTNLIGWPETFYTNFYILAWMNVKKYFVNTVIIAFWQIALTLAVSSAAAYGLTRYDFKGREAVFIGILSLMMIPGILTLIPQYVLSYKFRLIGSRLGVVVPTVAGSLPFGIFLLRSFFQGVHRELFEAAEIDGASKVGQFFRILLPLSRPILFTLGLSSLMTAWNDLVWPRLILMNSEELHTISVGIFELTRRYGQESFGMGVPLAAYVIVSIPLLIAFFLASKQFISGLTSGAFKM